jgi:endonuclease/exonuclease/phosphatase family metal-dependent hydrolase
MSFNVRYSRAGSSEAKSENNWNDEKFPRRERVLRVIREYGPDILGIQEARHPQIVDLREALNEYEFYGIGRDDGKTGGEYAGIFFRRERFSLLDAGSFWLSDTPEKPGTSFYKVPGAVPRMATWVRLRDKSGKSLLALNTHWDHISEAARQKSAAFIRDRLKHLRNGAPTIVMGDLNATEDTPAIQSLTQGKEALVDSYRAKFPKPSAEESTFGGWEGTRVGHRIDFILHTRDIKPVEAAIDRTSYDGRWPSDHYPVTAMLQFESRSE